VNNNLYLEQFLYFFWEMWVPLWTLFPFSHKMLSFNFKILKIRSLGLIIDSFDFKSIKIAFLESTIT